MNIFKINNNAITDIRLLWEELNSLHERVSNNFKQNFSNFSFEKRINAFKDRYSFVVFVAKENNYLIGYCIASVKGSDGEIDSIFIDASHRRMGMGEKLMASAVAWLNERNVDNIHVYIAKGNESVLGFYEKLDFLHRFTVMEKKSNQITEH
jgi:ribosomal protein S18 acetylase RimI-like enzyme